MLNDTQQQVTISPQDEEHWRLAYSLYEVEDEEAWKLRS